MTKRIAGFALIAISLILMGIWEFWGRETISYETILVLKNPLPAHTVVSTEDFELKKVESPSREALREENLEQLVGMETFQFVAENTELRAEYFCQSKYATGIEVGKGTMELPIDWLMSVPQTLMRGDAVEIYSGNAKVGDVVISHVRDSSNNEIIYNGRDRKSSTGVVNYIEIIAETSTLIEIAKLAAEGTRFTFICT